MGYNDKEMKNFEIRIVVSAPDIETVEDWFCGTIMGETGICEIQTWGVLNDYTSCDRKSSFYGA